MTLERGKSTFVISSWVFARALGAALLIAFLSLGVQAQGLFGERGVAPIAAFVDSAHRAGHSFFDHPTLLWFGASDAMITAVWMLGVIGSVALLVGWLPKIAALVCWL
ncbi:MAG: hypothetical protein OES69_06650, partial [Myxococcales bacterium]|nr:hypothetical protein [Myxococcales bacterium]